MKKLLLTICLAMAIGCQSEVQLLRSVVRDNTDLSFDKLDGPQGGTITSLIATKEGVLFAGVEGRGVYRSTDRGDTWAATGFQQKNVWPLYATPGGGILAFMRGGLPGEKKVLRSDDLGATWTDIPDSVASYFETTVIRVSGEAIYTEGKGGLHLSTDDGYTWETLMDGPPGYTRGGQYHLEILSDSIMFCMHYHGMYQSYDGGRSWEQRLSVYDRFSHLEQDPFGGVIVGARDTSIHIGMHGPSRLLRVSMDGRVTEVLPDTIWIGKHLSTVLESGTMLAGSSRRSQGVYRSEDGGSTWKKTTLQRGVITRFIQTSDGTVFAAAYGGILRSHDDGRTWEDCSVGLPSLPVRHLFKNDKGRIFAGTTNGGLYAADDPRDTWGDPRYGMCSVYQGFEQGSTLWIGVMPVLAENIYDEIRGRGNIDYFYNGLGLAVSSDAGQSWKGVDAGRRLPWRIVSGADRAVFTDAADLNTSTDGGKSWTNEPMHSEATGLCHGIHGLFAVRGDSLHFRRHGEETWTTLLAAPKMWRVENTDSVLVVSTLNKLYRSTDLGETWQTAFLDEQWYLFQELSRPSPEMMTMTGLRERCLVSMDTGRSWTQFIPGSYRHAHVLSVLLDHENHLLLGTREGLYRSRLPLSAEPPPRDFELGTPYHDSTAARVLTVPYSLKRDSFVRLTLQDASGMDIMTYVEERQNAGKHSEVLSDSPAPGEYSILLNVDGRVQRRQIVID